MFEWQKSNMLKRQLKEAHVDGRNKWFPSFLTLAQFLQFSDWIGFNIHSIQ